MTKTEYNPKTGEIGFHCSCSDGTLFELNTNDERGYLDGELDRETQYVDISIDPIEIKIRPSFTPKADKESISSDGVDVLTVTGLPKGTTKVVITGPISISYEETRQRATITTNVLGTYRVRFIQWPYINAEVTFDAC